MVEIDTEAALRIEHTASVAVVRIPLSESPSEMWRGLFRSVDRRVVQADVVDVDGRTWIHVVIQKGGIEGSEADADMTVERLEKVVELVASANRREAEQRDLWADFDDRLRSWWASQSTR